MESAQKQPQLVQVEWEDSARPMPEWMHLSDAPKLEVIECVSVGWLIGENKRILMLAPNIGDRDNGNNAQACGFIRIPRKAILRITRLVERKRATCPASPSSRPGLKRNRRVSEHRQGLAFSRRRESSKPG